MAFVLLAIIGFMVGYHLEMTRTGYVTMALTAVGSSISQITHLLVTKSPESITLLPFVIGSILVLFMLIGAIVKIGGHKGTLAA